MRIAETTPDRLTLESRPWVLGSALVVAMLVFLGLGLATFATEPWLGLGMGLGAALTAVLFVVFVRRVIVIFDRRAGGVVIRTASLLGQTERTLRLADVTGAGVETSISRSTSSSSFRDTVSHTHRPVLQTTTGDVPLTIIYSSGNGAAQMAEAINLWLQQP